MNSENNVTGFLRGVGVISFILAAINFMVSGRYDLNSLHAHYLFLGVNVTIAILGILLRVFFNEKTSSKTFSGLSLALIPVHMAQLGAFIYSEYSYSDNSLPELLQLSLPDGTGLFFISSITILALSPMLYFGFKTLYQDKSNEHIKLYALSSLLILIPIREPSIIYGLIFTSCIANYFFSIIRMNFERIEAKISATILYIPSAIMLGRLAFYPKDSLFYVIFTATATFLIFSIKRNMKKETHLDIGMSIFGNLSLFFLSLSLYIYIGIKEIYMFATVYTALAIIVGYLTPRDGKVIRALASTFMLAIIVPSIKNYESSYELLLLLVPTAMTFVSTQNKERYSLAVSVLTLLLSILILAAKFITIPNLGAWEVLTIIGISLILLSGLYDKKKDQIQDYFSEFTKKLK